MYSYPNKTGTQTTAYTHENVNDHNYNCSMFFGICVFQEFYSKFSRFPLTVVILTVALVYTHLLPLHATCYNHCHRIPFVHFILPFVLFNLIFKVRNSYTNNNKVCVANSIHTHTHNNIQISCNYTFIWPL